MAETNKVIVFVFVSLLLSNFVLSPAFATRTIQVTKPVDVAKDVLALQLADLKSYKEIFPEFVKDVNQEQGTNRTKFVIDAQGTREAYVTSKTLQNNTFAFNF